LKTIRACVLALAAITSAATAKPQQQKPAAAQPTQAQLQQQIDELKQRLADGELKAKSADLDKDYITRIQKQYETYYEKAFNTQVAIISIITLLITIVLWAATRFGLNIFERLNKSAIGETSAQLRADYTKALADEVQKLKDLNDTNIKELEQTLTSKISQLGNDILDRTQFQFQFTQALAFSADKKPEQAIRHYRSAIKIYKEPGTREIITKETAAIVIGNILGRVGHMHPENSETKIKEELAKPLYDDLEDELAHTAMIRPKFAALISQRKTPETTQRGVLTGPAADPQPPAPAESDTESE
jgi:hypothetical protein